MRCLVPLLAAAGLAAAAAQDVIAAADASLTETQRDEPGSAARAEAIAAALEGAGDLPAAERLAVRLALAEAWLDALQPQTCADIATAVQRDATATPPLRERAALARAAAARALLHAGEAPAAALLLDALDADGDAGPRAAAHRHIAHAEIGMALGPERKPADVPAALDALDRALALLADAAPADRVPVYVLRLTAMERGGAKPAEVLAWLQARAADPAAAEVAAAAVTEGDRLVGRPAPPLAAPRLDRAGEAFDLAALRGRTVLIDFFATWCEPCAAVAPAVARFAAAHPEVQVIGVSLDNAQTLPELPAFMAKHAITWPVVGERLGWDGDIDDAWHVQSIPSLVLVTPAGTILANDLIGDGPDDTVARLEAALAPQPASAPAPGGRDGGEAPFP